MARRYRKKNSLTDTLFGVMNYAVVRAICLLPYPLRIPFTGWFFSRVLAPVTGMNKRVRANLAHIHPDMPEKEIRAICRASSDNAGRLLIENFSTDKFVARAAKAEPQGPGYAAMQAARDEGKPVILVSGHFGNYQAVRVALAKLGAGIAGIYRPMNNTYFNSRYVETMEKVAGPNFSRGRSGTKNLLRHLRAGGSIAMLIDQHSNEGSELVFMGQPANTILSAAEFALKYKAVLIPSYGIRKENGLDFDIWMDAPIPHTDPVTMTQALNDSLEVQVKAHPGQWLWIHRRWKPKRQRWLQRDANKAAQP